jgi:hypothetical protein
MKKGRDSYRPLRDAEYISHYYDFVKLFQYGQNINNGFDEFRNKYIKPVILLEGLLNHSSDADQRKSQEKPTEVA